MTLNSPAPTTATTATTAQPLPETSRQKITTNTTLRIGVCAAAGCTNWWTKETQSETVACQTCLSSTYCSEECFEVDSTRHSVACVPPAFTEAMRQKVLETQNLCIQGDRNLFERLRCALTADEVIAYCRENMTAYKVPRNIEFREDLPKTNVGKILRRALREEELAKRAEAAEQASE